MLSKKAKNYLLSTLALCCLSVGANAQVGTNYQNWTAFPDSPTHLEVSWSACKCDPLAPDEIRLFVFNESGDSRTADFTLTISDAGQADVTYTVADLSLNPGESIQADCGKTTPSELTIAVPSGFDARLLTVSITYN